MPIRPITTYADLLTASDNHPVVRYDVAVGEAPLAFASDGAGGRAIAFLRNGTARTIGISLLGDAAGIDTLLGDPQLVEEWFGDERVARASVPIASLPVLERHLRVRGDDDWEWMHTTSAPPVNSAVAFVELDASSQPEVSAFLAAHSPRTHGQPFARPGQRWLGVRGDDGALIGCGCCEPNVAGNPVLSGIAVDPAVGGRGLGTAITAELTRAAVERYGVCTLGMYAENDRARAIYRRLGYATAVTWASRSVIRG